MVFEKLEPLRREEDSAPNFRGRYTLIRDESPPVRAYFHASGISAFGPCLEFIEKNIWGNYLKSVLDNNVEIIKDAIFLICAIWGDRREKMIDIFKYDNMENWTENPNVSAFVMRNGVYLPERTDVTCGDTLIVLGAEESYRRKTKSLKEYIENPPKIPGLVRAF